MCNFQTVQNDAFTAVFVNRKKEIPNKCFPMGVYRIENGIIQELYKYEYLFENFISYDILDWENRESLDVHSYLIIKSILEQQKGFGHLLK